MKILIFILTYVLPIIILLVILFLYFHCKKTNNILKKIFKNHSVIAFGAKGKGKDLLFQKVIYMRKKEPYESNISYGYKYIHKDIRSLSVEPNTYEEMIDGKISQIVRDNERENRDYYLSDGGIYLPAQYDFLLHKKYKSLPIYYATSRHLYNQNIHVNVQNLERLWKALREQADYYIYCVKKVNILGLIFCKIITYDKYQSAVNKLLPMKKPLFNKDLKARVEQYKATNGEILKRIYVIKKKHIKYDTRVFATVFFGNNWLELSKKID